MAGPIFCDKQKFLCSHRTNSANKISKFVATRCQILRLICTKFDFRWGSTPDPTGGAYSVSPDPLAVFKGSASKEREGKTGGEGR